MLFNVWRRNVRRFLLCSSFCPIAAVTLFYLVGVFLPPFTKAADYFKIRIEYVKGIDSFKTNEDIEAYILTKSIIEDDKKVIALDKILEVYDLSFGIDYDDTEKKRSDHSRNIYKRTSE